MSFKLIALRMYVFRISEPPQPFFHPRLHAHLTFPLLRIGILQPVSQRCITTMAQQEAIKIPQMKKNVPSREFKRTILSPVL